MKEECAMPTADIFYHNQLASGVIPQITASIGPSAGGSVYSPAMTDFVIMVEKVGTMFVTGPDVVKTVLGEEISFDDSLFIDEALKILITQQVSNTFQAFANQMPGTTPPTQTPNNNTVEILA